MKNGHEQSDDDEDDEEFDEEHEVWEWENSEAVQMIQPNVVVIWSDDSFNPYYLIKTMTEAVEIDVPFTDDYWHFSNWTYNCERPLPWSPQKV